MGFQPDGWLSLVVRHNVPPLNKAFEQAPDDSGAVQSFEKALLNAILYGSSVFLRCMVISKTDRAIVNVCLVARY